MFPRNFSTKHSCINRLQNNLPGTCKVEPKVGSAMNTSFAINCSGWQDPDQPLPYEFSYINYEHESVFYVSSEPFAPSVVLPMGHEDNDFNLVLNIQITDHLGASTIEKVLIKVGGCDRNLFGL